MITPAIFATLMPWILFVSAILAARFTGHDTKEMLSTTAFAWMLLSPIIISAGMLVAYREGQWSKKK